MTKNEWIKLINAIRLRKKEYSGQDGEISYHFSYSKASNFRGYLENGDGVQLNHDECRFGVSTKQHSFGLTCVYGHEAFLNCDGHENYPLEKLKKYHPREAFTPHISTAHPTTTSGAFSSFPNNADRFVYNVGLYAAAFLYAFDVKDPYLQLIDDEWIVVDSKTGYFDFITYFYHHQVIPIELPIPKFIDAKQVPILKLANGVEIKDSIDLPSETTNTDDAGEYLNEIRRSIEENQTT
ncbi:hypothetical protein V0288_00160 [Pannus brasiliensis CCIBt3594]|uniref:Uncharacterized protein n=1 Tax=Pannus brasiliensis CCIBt3594 TaxID=1427578 RepID=A0AAW9QRQ4_9CHRO